MKRKVKLFSAIASLCLAVALMAFGVYAATSVQWTVSSTVSFVAQVSTVMTANVQGGSQKTTVTRTLTVTPDIDTGDEGEYDINNEHVTGEAWPSSVVFDPQDKSQISFWFTVENAGAAAIDVEFKSSDFASATIADKNFKVTYFKNEDLTKADTYSASDISTNTELTDLSTGLQISGVEPGKVVALKVVIELKSATKELSAETFSIVIKATKAAA